MTASIQDIYRGFLRREVSLDDLRDWLAKYQWDLPEDEQALADEADVALVHLDDGYSNEFDLRIRLGAALERCENSSNTFVAPLYPVDLFTGEPSVFYGDKFMSRRTLTSGSITENQNEQLILAPAV